MTFLIRKSIYLYTRIKFNIGLYNILYSLTGRGGVYRVKKDMPNGWNHSTFSRVLMSAMVVMTMLCIVDSYMHDNRSKKMLMADRGLWVNQDIDRVIDLYFIRRSLNKSHLKKVIHGARDGAIRGAAGGAISYGPAGIIPGAFLFGIMGAASVGVKYRLGKPSCNVGSINRY